MMIGKRISGRYKILEIIGGGGMANVYLAHDMILDRDVALKMLRLDFANDEEFIRRFHREAQSATSLAHSNIVSIYDVGEEDSIYYIVMEYVDGQTLKQYIQQNSPLQTEDVIEIMKQLTSAISHAHQNHIIHRDIKPHNILLDRQGNVKITDFGIAMALSSTSITQTNSVIGSVHYLSPEQARGGMANRKSDIYSLGIVMFELLTGRLPFSGESAVSIALKHLQSETPSLRRWNPSIPQSVENIVLKATAKDPFHRYNNVEEMEDDLSTALYSDRINENRFIVPVDNDATKAIPIITDEHKYGNIEETVVHDKNVKAGQNHEKQKPQKEKKKRKKWPVVLVSIFFSLIILIILAITVLPNLLSPKEVAVPDVTGKEIEVAIKELENAGFIMGEQIPLLDEDFPEGQVIKTDPKAEKLVKEGSEITIYVSSGKEKFELDDYTGQLFDDVVALLARENFMPIKKNEITDEKEPAGTILAQNYNKGDEVVPEETELSFTVSKGPELITLKDLKDYNKKALQVYEDSTGLVIEITKEDYHEEIPEGYVISQDPVAGTELSKGSKVSVVISKGKKEIPPKTVYKEVLIPYEPAEEGQEQEVQIYIDDMNHSMTEPYETQYITENFKIRLELTIPYGQKAGYRVIRDNKVISEEVVPYPE